MDNITGPSHSVPEEDREDSLRGLAARLGVKMHDPLWFDRALTHASSIAEDGGSGGGDYESLEFLGDAVLGLAVAHYLFTNVPDRTPGEYSRMRAAMVNRQSVGHVGLALGIASFEAMFSGGITRAAKRDGVSLTTAQVPHALLHHGFTVAFIFGVVISIAALILTLRAGADRAASRSGAPAHGR